MTDELVEQVARALCELHIRNVRRHDTDPERLEEMLPAAIDYAWHDFASAAEAAIAAITAHTVPREEYERVVAALQRHMSAVEALGKSPPGRKDNYFEAPLSVEGAIERWQELDQAGKNAREALSRKAPQ